MATSFHTKVTEARDSLAQEMLTSQQILSSVNGLVHYALAINDKILTARLNQVRLHLEHRAVTSDRKIADVLNLTEKHARPAVPDPEAIQKTVDFIAVDVERRIANGELDAGDASV